MTNESVIVPNLDPDMIDKVFTFNELIIGAGDIDINPLDDAKFNWTMKAYSEEMVEFAKGYKEQDAVQMVDATFDLIYFALGTLKKMGLSREQAIACFNHIHEKNMLKKKGKLETRGNHEDDAVKPAEWVGPEEGISQILFLE